jgi:PAS domain S-box
MSERSEYLDSPLVDTLFSQSRAMLLFLDGKGRILKANLCAAAFYGKSPAKLVGQDLGHIFGSDSLSRLEAALRELSIPGESHNLRLSAIDGLGAHRELDSTLSFIAGMEGSEEGRLLTMREAESSLNGERATIDVGGLLERLMKGLTDSVMLIDYSRRAIRDCNRAAEDMFGYSREELIGRSPQFLAASPDRAKQYVEASNTSYAEQAFFQSRMECRRKDGSLFVTLATNLSFFASTGELRYILAINRDTSAEERQREEMLRISEKARSLLGELDLFIAALEPPLRAERLSDLGFSPRQIEIARLVLAGETTKVIAAKLHISESAVKSHLSSVYRRLGAGSRLELLQIVARRNIRID